MPSAPFGAIFPTSDFGGSLDLFPVTASLTQNSQTIGTAESPAHIAIIGGGASGTLLLQQLSRSKINIRVVHIDPAPIGPGLPYTTPHPGHVLNVPAGRMSAFPDDAEHFIRWTQSRGYQVGGGDFVPRGMYGEYLKHLADQAAASLGPRLRTIRARATDLHLYTSHFENVDRGRLITLDNGHTVHASHVVLALGNFTPANPAGLNSDITAHANYFRDPWTSGTRFADALQSADARRGVLVIGTGLSMMDIVMQIRSSAPDLHVTAISRRGLVSQPHRSHHHAPATQPPPPIDYWPNNAKGLLRAIRTYVQTCQKREIDWREAITALRPVTARLWQSMSIAERDRFLRTLVPYWDTHRHRCAPSIAEAISDSRAKGKLDVMAARLGHISAASHGFEVTLHLRNGGVKQIAPGLIINCTGPHMDLSKVGDPLIASLLAQGAVHQDALRIGMELDGLGRPLDHHGMPHTSLWTIGPLRRALLWETIAIPEIRVQAAELSQQLVAAIDKTV